MHPAPGNTSGTLVNGILHHCDLPNVELSNEEALPDAEDFDDEFNSLCSDASSCEGLHSRLPVASIRPGIVHRLDKGTTGLLVVAKVFLTKSELITNCHFSEEWKFLFILQKINN